MTLSNRAHYLLLLSLLISATCNQPSFHTCDHDKIEQNFGFADIEEDMSLLSGDRVLAASPSFRMYAYYDFMNTSTDSTYASYIRNSLVPPVIDYFQAALKVRYPVSGNLSLSSTVKTICEQNTPTILKTGLPTDFFIYYDTFADNTTQIANSKYCYLASGTRRPLVARTLINRNMLPLPDDDVLVHEKNMYTIMHEVIHTLGFGSSLFNYFIDDNGNTRTGHIMTIQLAGLTRTVIDVPPLTNKMKAYYGCSTLLGAVLENDGGSGTATSHFEKKYFNYEAMASGSIFGRRISEFSLAVLEGSGWYYPDYTYAEPFFYGQGLGCSFLDATCNSTSTPFDEYCVGSPKGCAAHGRGGGWCSTDPLTDGCKYIYPSEDYDCENDAGADNARLPELQVYGRAAGSRCFDGNLSSSKSSTPSAFCFKYNCTGSGLSTQVQVQVGKTSILCTKAEKKAISGYYGFIDCPDPVAFCNTVGKRFCPRNCMGRGTCVNNQCQCKPGYNGTDCALNV